MEIGLNNDETRELIKFSIREYVAEIRKKYPKKCWPFGSLGDPDTYDVFPSHHSSKSAFLSGQNRPGDIKDSSVTSQLTEAPNYMIESLGIVNKMGKIADSGSVELTSWKVNNGQNRHKNSASEGAKVRHNVAADSDEPEINQPRRKPRKFRLLTDIYKDPASELRTRCDITNPEIVNRSFVTEINDDDDNDDNYDDVKQKGVEITDLAVLMKKGNITGVEVPRVDQDKKSKHGFKDSYMDKLECSLKSNQSAEVTYKEATGSEKDNEDSEMVAVMLLARHFIEEKRIPRELETNPSCACVKKKIRKRSTQSGRKSASKTSSKKVMKISKEKVENYGYLAQRRCFTPVCSFNRNPADFSIPNAENKFMR